MIGYPDETGRFPLCVRCVPDPAGYCLPTARAAMCPA